MGTLPVQFIINSLVFLAGLGQALAQDLHFEIPATEVRQLLMDEGCPNTSVRDYGKSLESDKHRLCLALALYAHGCLPDPRGQRSGPAFARGFACYQELHGQSQPKRDRSAPRPLGDVFWPDDKMILRILAGHVEGSTLAQTVRATQDAPAHLEVLVAQAAQVSDPIQSLDLVPLFFHEIGEPSPGKRTTIHEGRFFNIWAQDQNHPMFGNRLTCGQK